VTARDHFRGQLKVVVGPALRRDGFRGSGTTWRLRNELGDVAIVNVQASQFGTRDDVAFVVNLGLVPEPAWAWFLARAAGPVSKQPLEYHASLRRRLNPSPGAPARDRGERWWQVTDRDSAVACTADVMEQLQSTGLPGLRELLDRDVLRREVVTPSGSATTSQGWFVWGGRVLPALLAADDGPGPALDAEIARLDERWEERAAFVAWLRDRARQSARTA